MANVFGILTAIVLALSVFIAYKNKAAYEKGIDETATQKANLKTSEERFTTAQKAYDTTVENKAGVDDEIAKLTEETTAVRKSNDDLKLENETKTLKVASNKEKLDDIRDKTARIGNIEELANKMREIGAELEELSLTIANNEARVANLTAQVNRAEAQAGGLRTKLDTLASGQSLPSLNTRIRSIYPTWGFVTLAAGNNSGIVTNSTLDVVRDDQTIAKLLVTAVESSSASASIVPDSTAPDTTLMVGDRVVASAAPASRKERQ